MTGSDTPAQRVVEDLEKQIAAIEGDDECPWPACILGTDEAKALINAVRSETAASGSDSFSPAAIAAEAQKSERKDPIADLCEQIKRDIRLCDHGYIHITCGQCVATWLRG